MSEHMSMCRTLLYIVRNVLLLCFRWADCLSGNYVNFSLVFFFCEGKKEVHNSSEFWKITFFLSNQCALKRKLQVISKNAWLSHLDYYDECALCGDKMVQFFSFFYSFIQIEVQQQQKNNDVLESCLYIQPHLMTRRYESCEKTDMHKLFINNYAI